MDMQWKWKLAAIIGTVFGAGMAIGMSISLTTKKGENYVRTESQPISLNKVKAEYPLLSPLRVLQSQDDFIVSLRPLRLMIEDLVNKWAEKGVVVAVQMEYLNTGSYLSVNQNYRMLPASLTKVPVAMMIIRRIEQGSLSFDQILEITEEDRDSKWGEMYKLPVGTKMSLRQVIEKSLIESDNTAHKMLYRLVGVEEAQEMSVELNLEDLFDKEGKISAREYAKLLRSLYTSSYLTAEHSQMMLELMSQDQVVKFLIRGLGDGVKYAHKFGESAAIYSYLDAGVVYVPNRPYVLVVMVHDEAGKERISREIAGREIFERVARWTHDYVVNGSL